MLFFLLFLPLKIQAAENPGLCQYFDIPSCSGVTKQSRRSSSQSLPSPAAASSMNPANVSFDRGFGIETLFQRHNSVGFSLASGTGKMGAALISSSLENSFFGNRTPELDDDLYDRHEHAYRYKSNKLTAAFGRKIIDGRTFGLDFGVSAKRHNEIGHINFGGGFSGRFSFLTFGASWYDDDTYLDFKNYTDSTSVPLSVRWGKPTYQEKFRVENYMVGVKVRMFTFDVGVIKTDYLFYANNSRTYIYSSSFSYRNFLFNAALRKEFSDAKTYSYQEKRMITSRQKNFAFLGAQYSLTKFAIIGLNYNFFLLNELSLTTSIFF